MGGWLNEDNRQFYFDSSKVFTSMKEAIAFGRKNKQISIFDLDTFTEIRL